MEKDTMQRYIAAGRKAFVDGKPRVPPEHIVNGAQPGAIRFWFTGYDLAKMISEADLDGLTPVVQLKEKRGYDK